MISFKSLDETFSYSTADQIFVNHLHSYDKQLWDEELPIDDFKRGSKARRTKIKNYIKMNLYYIQGNYCIYCGNKFRRKRDAEREHILPKSKYPKLAYHPKNLVLSCQKCNDPDHKGTIDFSLNSTQVNEYTYDDLELEIIHPYLDNFFEHLNPNCGPIIEIINNSFKGRRHIEVFGLNKGWNLEQREMFFNKHGLIGDIDTENIIGSILAKSYQIN